MRRPLATATLLLVFATASFVPAAGAQETNLTSCSFSPSEFTLRPGESVELTLLTDPAEGPVALATLTLDGEVLGEANYPSPFLSTPLTVTQSYEDYLEALASEDIFITSGVLTQSLAIVVGEGEDERFETLCSFTAILVGEPDPTTTTTTTLAPDPEPEPATPRFTG